MKNNFKRTTITAALPYANGPVHIGHMAGVYVPADIYARYLRLKKRDVIFIGGSDEHGVPITIRARRAGSRGHSALAEWPIGYSAGRRIDGEGNGGGGDEPREPSPLIY